MHESAAGIECGWFSAAPSAIDLITLPVMSKKGNKMAKISSWYRVRCSELRRVFHHILYWHLKPQPLDLVPLGFVGGWSGGDTSAPHVL